MDICQIQQNHNLLFITVSFLIILGGIGFPILVNLKETLFYYLRYLNGSVSDVHLIFSNRSIYII